MKKNKISISTLKVQSFVTNVPTTQKVLGGGESNFNTVCVFCTGDFGSDCIQKDRPNGNDIN